MELAGAGEKPAGHPWLTFGLLAALVIVFCCEIAFGLDAPTGLLQPSVRTLAAMGGSNRTLVVGSGEWYRVISAPFLHAGLIHLSLNGFVLLWAGPVLEGLLGRAWFAAVYAVSAVAGVILSMALSPASVVSVGASGALMGLLATLFVVSFHFTPGLMRARLQTAALQVLIPSLIPLAPTVAGQHVDYGAHLGGILGGALMGLILSCRTLMTKFAAIAAVTKLATSPAAAMPAASHRRRGRRSVSGQLPSMDLRATLIPNSQLPRTDAEMKSQVESLAVRYPHDPRPRLFRGLAMLDAGDSAGAERELRAGLSDAQTMKNLLPPRVEALLRTNLAMALYGNRQKAEARTIAAPVCQLDTAEGRPMRAPLRSIGICD